MKPPPLDIVAPDSLPEALALLSAHHLEAKILAGGQSLVPILAMRLASPRLLIDLNRIPALASIREGDGGRLEIGALSRHRAVERSALVAARQPLLAAAMPLIAHVQIRNRGTIGGSLAHADPAAELPAVCIASHATLLMASTRGSREIPAAEFFLGVFDTALSPDEILVEVRFPPWPAGRRWGFEEVARRHGDFALCGIALTLDGELGGPIEAACIVAFGIADRPLRLTAAEEALIGCRASPQTIAHAARSAAVHAEARGDHHASAQYRIELLEVLTRRSLAAALGLSEPETEPLCG